MKGISLVPVTTTTATVLSNEAIIGEVESRGRGTWRFRSRFGGYGDTHGRDTAIAMLLELRPS